MTLVVTTVSAQARPTTSFAPANGINMYSVQQKSTSGYAPVSGLNMYYEIHGSGEPVVLLHGAFMTITNNWGVWISELAKKRKVIAVEMQGHGRTADCFAANPRSSPTKGDVLNR